MEQARAFRRVDNYPEAWDQLQVALGSCPKDRPDLMGGIKAMEGQLFRDEGNLQEAIESYQLALGHFKQMRDQLMIAHTLRHLAEIRQEVGDLEAARNDYEACSRLYDNAAEVSKMDLANFYRAYALFLEQDQAEKSVIERYWERAKAIYTEYGIEEGVKECDLHLR